MKIDTGTPEGATLATISTTLQFCTGIGKYYTHGPEVKDSATGLMKPNPNPRTGQDYDGISGREIVALVASPQDVPKDSARWFIPSTFRGSDARTATAQGQRGEFWFLPVDIDPNNISLEDLDAALVAVCGEVERLIYSSKSSTADKRKWRALIPLQTPLSGADFPEVMGAFGDLLLDASQGEIQNDGGMQNPNRVLYLPNRGAFYQCKRVKGPRLDLQSSCAIMERRGQIRAKSDAEAAIARAKREARARQAPTDQGSVIQHFNAAYSVADTLDRYGFKRAGCSANYRSPMQSSGSYATRDYGDYWVSLSSSDAAAGLGTKSASGACFGDAFDLYRHFDHGGDFRAAVSEYSKLAGLDFRSQQADDRGLSGGVTLDLPKRPDAPEQGGNAMAPFEQLAEAPPVAQAPTLPPYVPPAAPEPRKSRFLKVSDLQGKPIPQREWLVQDLVPSQTVTLFSGDGGTGKSLLTLQLAAAVSMPDGRWLGRQVTQGNALVISAEDDEDELHRRWADIAEANGVPLSALANLEYRSLAGEDALLALMTGVGAALVPSALYHEVDAYMTQHRPSLLVLDTCADLYPANENDRAQVRQFVGLLRGLALRHRCAVILLSHPSLSGMSSGTGSSGSTAWNNSVRSRLYLERVTEDGYEADTKARRLSNKKSNYGPTGLEITMTWRDGVFHADAAATTLDRSTASMKAERVFLKMLRQFADMGRQVNGSAGPNYAPAVFANSKEAEGCTKRALRAAMETLYHSGKIRNETSGPPSKPKTFLSLTE